jgi:hypothetical protein
MEMGVVMVLRMVEGSGEDEDDQGLVDGAIRTPG